MCLMIRALLSLPLCAFAAELSGPALEVFIIPHSHEDTGWGNTADTLYINKAQWILSTVVPALESSRAAADGWPLRKYSHVEIAYLERWWHEQSPAMKDRVRGVVKPPGMAGRAGSGAECRVPSAEQEGTKLAAWNIDMAKRPKLQNVHVGLS